MDSIIEWDSSLETGDSLVDQQHRAIHQLAAQLGSSSDNAAEIMRTLDYLTEYVLVHFMTEEDLMIREEYPVFAQAEHILQHREFTEATRDQVVAFKMGKLTSTAPLAEFLGNWLQAHVHEYDRLLIDWVRARGSSAVFPERLVVDANKVV